MNNLNSLKKYKDYWEGKENIPGNSTWDRKKILKITLFRYSLEKIINLGFTNHSITLQSEQFIVRVRIPRNYKEIKNIEEKIIQALGINKDWIIKAMIVNSNCKSSNW